MDFGAELRRYEKDAPKTGLCGGIRFNSHRPRPLPLHRRPALEVPEVAV